MPAIEYAQQWVVDLSNILLEQKKIAAEKLRDLLYIKCFITSDLSRVQFDETAVGQKLWSIIGVYPKIEYIGTLPATPINHLSAYAPSVSYVKSYYAAKLITKEQANINRKNPFMQGNEEVFDEELRGYAYINFGNYSGAYNNNTEIEILPKQVNKLIAIEYLKQTEPITVGTVNIELPESLTNIIVTQALNWLANKQGTSVLKQVTEQDISTLAHFLM